MDKETRENSGKITAAIGSRIKEVIEAEYPGIKVYYDHGPAGNKRVVPKLRSTGKNSRSRYQSLAWVDIGIIDQTSKKALMLIEIEERPAAPKAVLGDLCNIFFADRVQVGGEDFDITDVRLILALTHNDRHADRNKAIIDSIQDVISPTHRKNIRANIINIGDPKELEEHLLREAKAVCGNEAPIEVVNRGITN